MAVAWEAAHPPRSELDVACDVLVRLLERRVLTWSPATVKAVCEATGIEPAALRAVWVRREHGSNYRPPTVRLVADIESPVEARPSPTEARYVGRFVEQTANAAAARRAAKEPEPGKRLCARCGELLPIEDFPVKNHATGQLRSYCGDCWKAKQRERYLSVDKEQALNAARLTFTYTDADTTALSCVDCGWPIRSGDHVFGTSSLHHVDCADPGSPRHVHLGVVR